MRKRTPEGIESVDGAIVTFEGKDDSMSFQPDRDSPTSYNIAYSASGARDIARALTDYADWFDGEPETATTEVANLKHLGWSLTLKAPVDADFPSSTLGLMHSLLGVLIESTEPPNDTDEGSK